MRTDAAALVETLTRMSESQVLDFKREQYKFPNGTDEEKSELVKDILAFANAWKTGDAHILIGAEEQEGGGATICGISQQIDDAKLQQLVNGKTNVPVQFEYFPFTIDGKQIAVILINHEQRRPIFLKKPFGRLKPGIVYLRRGSSTGEADPDEIARMGAHAAVAAQDPVLQLTWDGASTGSLAEPTITVTSTVLREQTAAVKEFLSGQINPTEFQTRTLMKLGGIMVPEPDLAKVIEHEKATALLSRVSFSVHNRGRVVATDVRVTMGFPPVDGLVIVDEPPPEPPTFLDHFVSRSPVVPGRYERDTLAVERNTRGATLSVRFIKIQPGASVRSEPFWIGCQSARKLETVARISGDNVPSVIEVPVSIEIRVKNAWLRER